MNNLGSKNSKLMKFDQLMPFFKKKKKKKIIEKS